MVHSSSFGNSGTGALAIYSLLPKIENANGSGGAGELVYGEWVSSLSDLVKSP